MQNKKHLSGFSLCQSIIKAFMENEKVFLIQFLSDNYAIWVSNDKGQ